MNGKENDLNQTSMIMFQPLILRGVPKKLPCFKGGLSFWELLILRPLVPGRWYASIGHGMVGAVEPP